MAYGLNQEQTVKLTEQVLISMVDSESIHLHTAEEIMERLNRGGKLIPVIGNMVSTKKICNGVGGKIQASVRALAVQQRKVGV